MEKNPEKSIQKLIGQEKEFVFEAFTHEDAFWLGQLINETAKEVTQYPLGIEITVNNLLVFCYYPDGITRDNRRWIRFKRNAAEMWEMSSLRIEQQWQCEGTTLESMKCTPQEFCLGPGAFPVRLRGTGMIGCISTSGCPGTLDHDIIVMALSKYFKDLKKR